MKRVFLFIALFAVAAMQQTNAQSCLPGGISFTSQAEVDAFAVNFPDCQFIEGDVTIGDPFPSDITDLSPLQNINVIGGRLSIFNNPNLTSLDGLDFLNVVGNGVSTNVLGISNNSALTDITALANLDSINGAVDILENGALVSLEGLENVSYIRAAFGIGNNDLLNGGDFSFESLENVPVINIYNNAAMVNLPAFPAVVGTIQTITIADNPSITSLKGLENIEATGEMEINNNDALTDLIGIGPLSLPFSASELTITNNASLTLCSVVSICNRLDLSNTNVTISGNATGCNSIMEVENECASSGCPTGDLVLTSHAEVNDFPKTYSNCADFPGSINIEEGTNFGDIVDLTPLLQLKSIGGHLYIFGNDDLELLTGLDNLETVGDYLSIDNNDNLLAPFGLGSLESIGDRFFVLDNDEMETMWGLWSLQTIGDGFSVQNNKTLFDFYGLRYVTSLGNGPLNIRNNDSLQYMAAIRSVDGSTISSLTIEDNASLSICEVKSICEYLDSPSGSVNISGNAIGCSDQMEVEEACEQQFGTQIGNEIEGPGDDNSFLGTQFGSEVALSGNGNRLAISDYWANDVSGWVRVYEPLGGVWTQIGSDINGQPWDAAYGAQMDFSDDGNRLVIGAFENSYNDNISEVQAYDWVNNEWVAAGDSIISNADNPNSPGFDPFDDVSIYSGFSLSGDGMRLSVIDRDRVTLPSVVGEVRVYQWQNNNWTQLGNSILGNSTPQEFEFDWTSLSQDGSRVAIGYQGSNLDNGFVRVYEYDGSDWTQVGNDIEQGILDDNFGNEVDISNDGNRVAINSDIFDSGTPSKIWVYEWQNNDWVQVGNTVEGNSDDRFGWSLKLSGDGNRIATSAQYATEDNNQFGEIFAYEWDGSAWTQLSNIQGQDQEEYFGAGLAMSKDGLVFAGGANGDTYDELGTGVVRVYGLPMSISTTTIAGLEVDVFPNPTAGFVQIKGINPDIVFVTDAMGRVVKQQRNGNRQVDMSQLPAGVYFLEIGKDRKWATVKIIKE